MVIGIKYCGGCNSVYNRGRQIELIKSKFPEHRYQTSADGNSCDIWLIVCGCMRACASTEGIEARKRMFILPTERSFVEVHSYLNEERKRKHVVEQNVAKMQREKKSAVRQLQIGQEAAFSKTFFRDDVDKFAALTGDNNRLHTNPEFAKKSVYGRPVIHGVLAASLISTVMGTKLPGEGTVLVEEQIRFLKPVFYGDTVTAKVRFVSCREAKKQYVGTFLGICMNQNGEIVAVAKCRQLMTREVFEVINPEETAVMPEVGDYWE